MYFAIANDDVAAGLGHAGAHDRVVLHVRFGRVPPLARAEAHAQREERPGRGCGVDARDAALVPATVR